MANNRMFLVHASGKRILLGKRMGMGWYSPVALNPDALNLFFDECMDVGPDQDDFCLAMESSPSKYVRTDWMYPEDDGPLVFKDVQEGGER